MAECIVCGDPTGDGGPAYRYSYCDRPVCRNHRLPESHGCSGRGGDAAGTDRDTPEPMEPNGSFPGSTPASKHRRTDSSPDVAVDGSVVGESETSTDSRSLLDYLLPWR